MKRPLFLALAAVAALGIATPPASALADDHGRHGGWHHAHDGYGPPRRHDPEVVYVAPPPYYGPPRVVAVAPPPMVYLPPPEPALTVVIPIHLR